MRVPTLTILTLMLVNVHFGLALDVKKSSSLESSQKGSNRVHNPGQQSRGTKEKMGQAGNFDKSPSNQGLTPIPLPGEDGNDGKEETTPEQEINNFIKTFEGSEFQITLRGAVSQEELKPCEGKKEDLNQDGEKNIGSCEFQLFNTLWQNRLMAKLFEPEIPAIDPGTLLKLTKEGEQYISVYAIRFKPKCNGCVVKAGAEKPVQALFSSNILGSWNDTIEKIEEMDKNLYAAVTGGCSQSCTSSQCSEGCPQTCCTYVLSVPVVAQTGTEPCPSTCSAASCDPATCSTACCMPAPAANEVSIQQQLMIPAAPASSMCAQTCPASCSPSCLPSCCQGGGMKRGLPYYAPSTLTGYGK